MKYKYAYRCPHCKENVFFFNKEMHPGDAIMTHDFYKKDGTQPESGGRMECPNCGLPWGTMQTEHIRKL